MKSILTLTAALLISTLSMAQLGDCFDADNWTANTNNTTAAVTITNTQIVLGNDMDFVGSGLDEIVCSEIEGTVTACVLAGGTGEFIFDWSIAGAPFFYNPLIERFGYCINGVPTELSSINPPPFGTSSGTDTIDLISGDELCFIYASKFGDGFSALDVTITNFSYPPCDVTCDASSIVDGLAASVSGTSAVLSWNDLPGAASYRLYGREAGTTTIRTTSSTTNSKSISALMPATTYEWVVKATCASGGTTALSAISTFSTASPRLGLNAASLSVFPNPASEMLTIETYLTGDNLTVELTNQLGQVVIIKNILGSKNQDNLVVEHLSIANVPAGIYWLSVSNGQESTSQKLVIQ